MRAALTMRVRRAIRELLGSGRSTYAPLGGAVPAAPVLSGAFVTPQTALGLTAVYAAVHVGSRDTAALPLAVYEKLPQGGLSLAAGHPLNEILQVAFDAETDAFRGRRDSMAHVLGWGNGYLEIERSGRDGQVQALHLLHPAKTLPKRSDKGALYYELDNSRRLAPEDCLHFAALGFDGLRGYSPITLCRQAIGAALAVEQFAAAFFGNSAIAKGVLSHPQKLTEEARNNLRRSVNEIHQGAQNAHQFLLLEEGMGYTQTSIPPEDSQFLQTRQFGVVDVARLFSMPPHKLGDYSQAHLANVEESNLDYLSATVVGWVTMLESQYNWKLLTASDRQRYVIRHDFSALLRGNTAARAAYYQIMRNTGAFSANDIRRAEGRNPLPPDAGGDTYIVQGQYVPLDQLGKKPEAPPAEPVTASRLAAALAAVRADSHQNGTSHGHDESG